MDKTSLGFQKPKEEEYYDINIFNQNAQLSNDLIEKNSSAIGQKLDKNSSFYADIEAYYGNTKLVDDFQDISKWTANSGVQSSDTTNFKIGNQALRLTETDNVAGYNFAKLNNINLDLSTLNNGEVSNENDFICLVCYISDITKIAGGGISFTFDQMTPANEINVKVANITSGLTTGWNFLKLKKSDFSTTGTGAWNNIKLVQIRWYSTANAQNAYVSFQLIQLVKSDPDTLIDIPNPFQKFGVKDFTILNGEWYVGKEFGELCIKELGSDSPTNPKSLIGKQLFQDCNINYSVKRIGVNGVSWFGILSEDGNMAIQVVVYLNKVWFRVLDVSTTLETLLEKSVDFISNVGDILSFNIQRKGNLFKLIANNLTTGIQVESNLEYVLGKVCLCVGRSQGNNYLNNLLSVSITEISHAHHSDIAEVAEVAKTLDYRDLRVPSILVGDSHQIKTFYKVMLTPTGQNEVEVDLGNSYFSGTLRITVSSGFNGGNASGSITKSIDFIGITSIVSQISKYIYVGENTKNCFMISDIYISGGRKKIKIIQTAQSRNSIGVILEGYGLTFGLENATISDPVASSETFVAPSMTPVETVITTGFAAGWSGQIRYRKNQENKASIFVYLTKATDITGGEAIYNLPIGFRPLITHTATCMLLSTGGTPLAFGSVWIDSQGAIKIGVLSGQILTNVRMVYCIALEYYS